MECEDGPPTKRTHSRTMDRRRRRLPAAAATAAAACSLQRSSSLLLPLLLLLFLAPTSTTRIALLMAQQPALQLYRSHLRIIDISHLDEQQLQQQLQQRKDYALSTTATTSSAKDTESKTSQAATPTHTPVNETAAAAAAAAATPHHAPPSQSTVHRCINRLRLQIDAFEHTFDMHLQLVNHELFAQPYLAWHVEPRLNLCMYQGFLINVPPPQNKEEQHHQSKAKDIISEQGQSGQKGTRRHIAASIHFSTDTHGASNIQNNIGAAVAVHAQIMDSRGHDWIIEPRATSKQAHRQQQQRQSGDINIQWLGKESGDHLVFRRRNHQIATGESPKQCHWLETNHEEQVMPTAASLPLSRLSTVLQERHHQHSGGDGGGAEQQPLATRNAHSSPPPLFASPRPELQSNVKTVEIAVVNDFARYRQEGSIANAETSTARIINAVDVLYQSAAFDPPVRVVLVDQVTWDSPDPYVTSLTESQEAEVETLLARFNAWSSVFLRDADNRQLMSGYNFKGATVGFAPLNTMCMAPSSGSILSAIVSEHTLATVSAHELGHNFGLYHDGDRDACPNSGNIMAAVATGPSTTFSTCSKTAMSASIQLLEARGHLCLRNVPAHEWGVGVCGDGIVQGLEQCDCGSNATCAGIDACCDATTCMLFEGSQCSESEPCCRSCQYIGAAEQLVCRQPVHVDCDVAEVCNGKSGVCPKDEYKGAGTVCDSQLDTEGLCFAGECHSEHAACADHGGSYVACMTMARIGNAACQQLYCADTSDTNTCFPVPDPNVAVTESTVVNNGLPCAPADDSATATYQCNGGVCMSSEELDKTDIFTIPPPTRTVPNEDDEVNIDITILLFMLFLIAATLGTIFVIHKRRRERAAQRYEQRQVEMVGAGYMARHVRYDHGLHGAVPGLGAGHHSGAAAVPQLMPAPYLISHPQHMSQPPRQQQLQHRGPGTFVAMPGTVTGPQRGQSVPAATQLEHELGFNISEEVVMEQLRLEAELEEQKKQAAAVVAADVPMFRDELDLPAPETLSPRNVDVHVSNAGPAVTASLPVGWTAHTTSQGRPYWFNQVTGMTNWTMPTQ